MKITLKDGRNINVFINHLEGDDATAVAEAFNSKAKKESINRVTQCEILDENNGGIAFALSVCVKEDNFVKRAGTIRSLVRALKDGGFSREDKKIVFDSIFRYQTKPNVKIPLTEEQYKAVMSVKNKDIKSLFTLAQGE